MKILSFSLDRQLLNPNSTVACRLAKLAQVTEGVDFIVPSQKKVVINLNEQVKVLGSGGQTKVDQFFLVWLLGKTLMDNYKYDLMTVQDVNFLAVAAICLARSYNFPVEVQVHGFEKNNWFKKIIHQFVFSRATGIRVVSNRLKQELINDYKVLASKIYVIPISSPLLNRSSLPVRLVNDIPHLLSVGRLVPVKGFNYLIEAVALLDQKKVNFCLDIVGAGGEYHHLNDLIKRLKLEAKVFLREATSSIGDYYTKADLVIIPSLKEGYSLVAVEAASFGLPIIMTDVGLAGELLINNQSAVIVPVGDTAKLAEAIDGLIKQPEKAQSLAKEAFNQIKKLPTEEESLFLYKTAWAKLL